MAAVVSWLKYAGARDTTGAVVASGRAYFYQPGTSTTEVSVFSDPEGTTAITQPVSLNAAGQAEVYVTAAARVEIQTAAGVTAQYLDTDAAGNIVTAQQVQVQNAGFTGTSPTTGEQVAGGITDLNTVATSLYTSTGAVDAKYAETTGATARTLQASIGAGVVRSKDFGAQGDDLADDVTDLQEVITRAIASSKHILLEPGTYRITSALTIGTGAAGLIIEGVNPADCIIKNMSTTGNAITVDLGSAIESHIVLRNFTITADSTSSGDAISVANGNGIRIENVVTKLHRTGFDVGSVSHAYLDGCIVVSTDSNAAGKGFLLGAHATATKCRVTAAASGTAFSMEGQYGDMQNCRVIAAATGVSVTAADCSIWGGFVGGCTTGISIGAIARTNVERVTYGTNTTDVSINASATLVSGLERHGAISDSAGSWLPFHLRMPVQLVTGTGTTDTLTPQFGKHNIYDNASTNAVTLTIAATTTTGLVEGDLLFIAAQKSNNTGALSLTWNAQYEQPNGVSGINMGPTAAGGPAGILVAIFRWSAATAKWRKVIASIA